MIAYFNFKDENKGTQMLKLTKNSNYFEKINMRFFDVRSYFDDIPHIKADNVTSAKIEIYSVYGTKEVLNNSITSYNINDDFIEIKNIEILGDKINGKYKVYIKLYSGGILLDGSEDYFSFEVMYDIESFSFEFYNASVVEDKVELSGNSEPVLDFLVKFESKSPSFFNYEYAVIPEEGEPKFTFFKATSEKISLDLNFGYDGTMPLNFMVRDIYGNYKIYKYTIFKDTIADSFVYCEKTDYHFSSRATSLEIEYISRNVNSVKPLITCDGVDIEPSLEYSEIQIEKKGFIHIADIFSWFPQLHETINKNGRYDFKLGFVGIDKTIVSSILSLSYDGEGPGIVLESEYYKVGYGENELAIPFIMNERNYNFYSGKSKVISFSGEQEFTCLFNTSERLSYITNGFDNIYVERFGGEWYMVKFKRGSEWVLSPKFMTVSGSQIPSEKVNILNDYSSNGKKCLFIIVKKESFGLNELNVISNNGGLEVVLSGTNYSFDEYKEFFICKVEVNNANTSISEIDVMVKGTEYSFADRLNQELISCKYSNGNIDLGFDMTSLVCFNTSVDLEIYPGKRNIQLIDGVLSFSVVSLKEGQCLSPFGKQNEISSVIMLEHYAVEEKVLCDIPTINVGGQNVPFSFELDKKGEGLYSCEIKLVPYDGYNEYELVSFDKFNNETITRFTVEKIKYKRDVEIDFLDSNAISDGMVNNYELVRSNSDYVSLTFKVNNDFLHETASAKKAFLKSEKYNSESVIVNKDDKRIFYFNIKDIGDEPVNFSIFLDEEIVPAYRFQLLISKKQEVICEENFISGSDVYMIPIEVTKFSTISFSKYNVNDFSIDYEGDYLRIEKITKEFKAEFSAVIELTDSSGMLPKVEKNISGLFFNENINFSAEIEGFQEGQLVHTPLFNCKVEVSDYDLVEEITCEGKTGVHIGGGIYQINEVVNPNYDKYLDVVFKFKDIPFTSRRRLFNDKVKFKHDINSFSISVNEVSDGKVKFSVRDSLGSVYKKIAVFSDGIQIFESHNPVNLSKIGSASYVIDYEFQGFKQLIAQIVDEYDCIHRTNPETIFFARKNIEFPKGLSEFNIFDQEAFDCVVSSINQEEFEISFLDIYGYEIEPSINSVFTMVIKSKIDSSQRSYVIELRENKYDYLQFVKKFLFAKNDNSITLINESLLVDCYKFNSTLEHYINGNLYKTYKNIAIKGSLNTIFFEIDEVSGSSSFVYKDDFTTISL